MVIELKQDRGQQIYCQIENDLLRRTAARRQKQSLRSRIWSRLRRQYDDESCSNEWCYQRNIFLQWGAILLGTRIDDIEEGKMGEVKQAQIMMTGTTIKQQNYLCTVCTMTWGILLIFSLFFTCFDWWKKIAYPIQDINLQAYTSLDKLLRCPNLTHLRLQVVDNLFDDNKAQTLYDAISRSSLKSFHFMNLAFDYDATSDEFSRFKQRMAPFKQLNMGTEIRWRQQVVI